MLEEGAGTRVVARDRRRGRFPRRRSRHHERDATSPPSVSTCRSHASPRPSRSWPTWRCGRRFRKTSSNDLRRERLTPSCRRATTRPRSTRSRSPRTLYGPTHRYGTATNGTAQTIGALTTDDLRTFYASRISASERRACSSSATRRSTRRCRCSNPASAAGSRTTAGLDGADQAAGHRAASRADVYLVDKPGAPQSQIRIGWIGVPRSTPDYFPIQVHEHDSRRVVLVASEHEPAREERLHVRRLVAFRHARRRRPVSRRRRRADRQDGPARSRSSSTS